MSGRLFLSRFARAAVALVWLYNGLWCKLLAQCPHHREVVAAVPVLWGMGAAVLLRSIGLVEVALAIWVLTGFRPRPAAAAQTALLILMNLGGLVWGRHAITDPVGLVVQNVAFLALVWTVAICDANAPARPL
jgi:uncharacterized membrane protein YphA (DoxX/SURF4 family)